MSRVYKELQDIYSKSLSTKNSGVGQNDNKEKILKPIEVLKYLLKKIISKKDVKPIEYIGFSGLLGDIGAEIQDYFNRPKEVVKFFIDKFNSISKDEVIEQKISKLEHLSKKFYAAYSPDVYYGSKELNRNKAKERGNCVIEVVTEKNCKKGVEFKVNMATRTGIFDLGKKADTKINIIKNQQKIPEISWPWQTVPKKLIEGNKCKDEPWAGHFSGSLYELILMQELLDNDGLMTLSLKQKTGIEKKKLYFASAASFLIALGMHSASEVYWVGKMYLNENSPIKISYEEFMDKYCSESTQQVSAIISSVTNSYSSYSPLKK